VLAELFTDFPARFAERPSVWLAPAGFAEAGPAHKAAPQPAKVTSHWLPVGRNAGHIVLHFADVDSISAAEALAGKEVVVPLSERVLLEDGSVYVSDLIGCTVYDRGSALGVIEAVQFPATPDGSRRLDDAAPLLEVVSSDGDELLIPFAKKYVLAIDTVAKAVRMELPAGLAELNRPQSAND
jgi:16S rRNA processing protein RimM